MTRSEVSGKRICGDADAYSVSDFCRRHGISPQLFYKYKSDMPATLRIGTRVLISKESAEAWRRERSAPAHTPLLTAPG
jgi:transposase-like protein